MSDFVRTVRATPAEASAPAARSERVTTIDGLRGIAAILVVLFHLYGAISRTATDWLWSPVVTVVENGFLGVDIFFVISGFVIALSVSRGDASPSYFGRFVVRRSIRLDPPYWAAIGLELILLWATQRMLPEREVIFPSGAQLAAHFVYLQELLGYGSIVTIFWTLCYEIQFYAFYVGLTVLRAQLPASLRGTATATLVMAVLFALSLWTRYMPPACLPDGLFINRWFQFLLGVLTWRAVTDTRHVRVLVIAWACIAVAIMLSGAPIAQLISVAVSAVVLAGVRYPAVGRLLRIRPLLFLGSISYSLYLFHTSVGWRFVSVAQLLMPGQWSAPTALIVYAAGVLLCVGVSAILWRLVERPLLELSQRVRLPQRIVHPPIPLREQPEAAA